jgi:hypothetical protein
LRRVGVASAAVGDDQNWSDPEIGGVARGRLDADFHRDARMASAATPQSRSAMAHASPPSTDDAGPHFTGQRRHRRRQGTTWHYRKIHLWVVHHSWSVSVKRFESLCRLIPAQFRSQYPGNASRDSTPTEKE